MRPERWVAFLVVLGLLAVAACDDGSDEPAVMVLDAVATPGDDVAAAYVAFRNDGAADTLTGATLEADDVAARVSLHVTEHAGGLATMAHTDAVPVGAGAVTTLEPGGAHLMLEELSRPLAVGDSFDLIFTFERSEPLAAHVLVVAADEVVGRFDQQEEVR